MTEKRFTIHESMVCDRDMKIPITLWQDKEQQKKFCDTLNTLHEENTRMQETLEKKEELLRNVLKVNDNLTKKVRELEEDNLELKEAMKRMMGDLMSR